MFGLKDAAAELGISESRLRKLVKRREIKYHQPLRHCPLKFRPEWLDEFRRRPGSDRPDEQNEPQSAVEPQTLADALEVFTPAVAFRLVANHRYPLDGRPRCPVCDDSQRVSAELSGACRCRECGRRFSIRENTAIESVPASLRACVVAAWCVSNGKDLITPRTLASTFALSQSRAELVMTAMRRILRQCRQARSSLLFRAAFTANNRQR